MKCIRGIARALWVFVLTAVAAIPTHGSAVPVWFAHRGSQTIGIVGTSHASRHEFARWQNSVISEFENTCSAVYIEFNPSSTHSGVGKGIDSKYATRLSHGRLSDLIGHDRFVAFFDRVKGQYALSSAANFEQMRPWIANFMMPDAPPKGQSSDAGAYCIDCSIALAAANQGAAVVELENLDGLVQKIASTPDNIYAAILIHRLNPLTSGEMFIDGQNLEDQWLSSDAKYISARQQELYALSISSLGGNQPAFAEIVESRNTEWSRIISGASFSGHVLVAVGLSHLVGPHSLLVELKRRGFEIEPAL